MGFEKANLPKAVAVKIPKGTMVPGPDVSPKPDDDVLSTLVGMLERGEVSAAIAAGREITGNDVRLALMGELLGVAEELPLPITVAIARGIVANDMSRARSALVTYRGDYPKEAHKATTLLAKRAPIIYGQIEAVPVPGVYSSPDRRPRTSASRIGLSSSLVLMGIIGSRCAAMSTHHDYDYHAIDNLRALDLRMPSVQLDPAMFDLRSSATYFSPDMPRQTQLDLIVASSSELTRRGSPSEVMAAREIRSAALANDCGQLVDAADVLTERNTTTDPLIMRHIDTISLRVHAVCP